MLCYKCKACREGKCLFENSIKSACQRTEQEVNDKLNLIKAMGYLDMIALKYSTEKDEEMRTILKQRWYKRLKDI